MHPSRSQRAAHRYRSRFDRVARRAERLALHTLLAAALLLVAGQLAMTHPDLRWYLSPVERWEGVPLAASDAVQVMAETLGGGPDRPWVRITLWNRRRAPGAVVLVNGAEVAAFTGREVVVAVDQGDVLEVDGLAVRSPLVFRITATHPAVADPPAGMEFATRSSIAYLGQVRLRPPPP